MMKKTSILAGAALLAFAGTAMAQPAAGPRGDRMADTTRQQAAERADQRFQAMDLNRDGRVTPEEMRQAAQQRRTAMAGRAFERMDANRDGNVSRAEFDQQRAQRQAQRAERQGGERAERGQRGPRAGMRGGHRGSRGEGARGAGMFGDQGFVTAEQFRARALERFDRMDLDRNGIVTAAERQQARQQMRQRMQERRGTAG